MAIQWIGLCVAAAMISAMLRTQRPALSTGLSLAVGAAVIGMLAAQLRASVPWIEGLRELAGSVDGQAMSAILRAAGITVVAELAERLCRDAGETAMAGQVALISRAAILALCAPVALRLVDLLRQLAP